MNQVKDSVALEERKADDLPAWARPDLSMDSDFEEAIRAGRFKWVEDWTPFNGQEYDNTIRRLIELAGPEAEHIFQVIRSDTTNFCRTEDDYDRECYEDQWKDAVRQLLVSIGRLLRAHGRPDLWSRVWNMAMDALNDDIGNALVEIDDLAPGRQQPTRTASRCHCCCCR